MVRKKKRNQKTKGALVRGYLEKKDRRGVELLFNKYRNVIGDSSGIYALYKGDDLYYVGIAKNLLWRIWWHMRDRHKNRWDKVSFFVIDRHRFSKDIETIILRILDGTRGNKTRGKFEGHYDLQDKLDKVRREMKDLARRV